MLDAATRFRKSEHQVSCNLDNEVAILDLKASLYFGLNDVGAHIWQFLDEPRSVDVICRSVAEQFDIGPAACHADVSKFLSDMQQAGLIEAVG